MGNDAKAYNLGVYAQEKLVWDQWIFRFGSRFNTTQDTYDLISGTVPAEKDKSWDKFLYSAGIKYNATPDVSLYSNIGTSFQAPSAKSVGGTLMASDKGVPGRNGQLPNPNLQPESGLGYDLGMDYRILKNLTFGVRGFLNQVEDAIVENRVSENPSQSQSVNAGKTTSYGFELELKHSFSKYADWFANFTYTKTKIENKVDPDQDGGNVPFVPDYVGNFGVTTYLPLDFTVSAYLQAVGTYYDSTSKSGRKSFGPYEVINMKIQKVLFKTKDFKGNFVLDLINLTNRKYEMPWQFQDPGFSMFGSIELHF
jgi:outer membrane receptor protein involved in Fe transport